MPIPREQFVESLNGMLGDARQNVGEPGSRIQSSRSVTTGALSSLAEFFRKIAYWLAGNAPIVASCFGEFLVAPKQIN
jgi:hypothetical protein